MVKTYCTPAKRKQAGGRSRTSITVCPAFPHIGRETPEKIKSYKPKKSPQGTLRWQRPLALSQTPTSGVHSHACCQSNLFSPSLLPPSVKKFRRSRNSTNKYFWQHEGHEDSVLDKSNVPFVLLLRHPPLLWQTPLTLLICYSHNLVEPLPVSMQERPQRAAKRLPWVRTEARWRSAWEAFGNLCGISFSSNQPCSFLVSSAIN